MLAEWCRRVGTNLGTDASLHQVHGGLQDGAALRRNQLSKRLRVEARGAKAQAAVHGVGGQLDGLLPDLCGLRGRAIRTGKHGYGIVGARGAYTKVGITVGHGHMWPSLANRSYYRTSDSAP